MEFDSGHNNLNGAFEVEQKKFAAVFGGTNSPMVMYKGPDFIIEFCNEAYQDIYAGRDILGRPILEAIPELKESMFPDILQRVYQSGERYTSREGLARLFNKSTSAYEERYFDTHFSRISFSASDDFRVLATPREITDKVVARKKLENSLKELEDERDLREKFVTALSHDLRSPLALVKVGAQILKRKANDYNEVVNLSEKIVTSINRADRMIRDLLDANRLKAGRGLPVSVHECRMELIIGFVLSELEELFGKKFKFENEAGEVRGYWDSLAIHRLIENLATNAVKYGSSDSLVTIKLGVQNEKVMLIVHNFGNPISLEDQASLFDLYDRTQSAESSAQSGWGVGLTLVKGLCEAHGGNVKIESSTQAGTSFIVTLPMNLKQT